MRRNSKEGNNKEQNNKEKSKMRIFTLCMEYLREKRVVICLLLFIEIIFLLLGCLYHLDNLPKLFYGALISCFGMLLVGIYDAAHYVAERKLLARAAENPEQAWELFFGEEGRSQSLNPDYMELVEALCEENRRFYSKAEERRTEQSDYYVLWAHQIKTPISAMRLLLNSSQTEGAQDRAKEKFLLQGELFKIEQYVEMALQFQRLDSMSSDMILEECSLHDMLKQVVKKYSVLFINRSLSLNLEEMEESVLTDEKWFCFCVEQILSNSIKYTTKGSISIYLERGFDKEQPESGEELVLVIEDTGIGIRTEDLPRIFERGFTGYNGRMDKKSTGIGLYLTKQVLDKLGIGVLVESREGQGTKVFLSWKYTSF